MAKKSRQTSAEADDKAPADDKPPASAPPLPAPALQPTNVVENLFAPEVFASAAEAISIINGMIAVTFTSSRFDQSTKPNVLKRVVVGRVVMAPAAARDLAVRMFALMEQNGLGLKPTDPKQRQ